MEQHIDYTDPDLMPPAWGKGYSWYWCEDCGRWQAQGGPAHEGSPRCRSGKRPHCSCNTCF